MTEGTCQTDLLSWYALRSCVGSSSENAIAHVTPSARKVSLHEAHILVDYEHCCSSRRTAEFNDPKRKGNIANMKKKTSVAMLGLLCILGLWLLEAQAADPNAASISGTVKLDGTPPHPSKIDMSQDPGCKGVNTVE